MDLNYFEFIPSELIELTIYHLNNDELINFLTVYDIKNKLNWKNIYRLHFGDVLFDRIIEYGEYHNLLSIERLKEKLQVHSSLEELYNSQTLNLYSTEIIELPKELFNLSKLESLFLGSNKIRILPSEISNLKNLKELNLNGNNIEILPKELFNLKKIL